MAYSIMVPITLSIEENGKISGNGGCNSFTGNFSYKKKKSYKKPVKIKFKDIVSTKLACEKPSRAENAFFQSLREADTIFIENEELTIKSLRIGNTMNFLRLEN